MRREIILALVIALSMGCLWPRLDDLAGGRLDAGADTSPTQDGGADASGPDGDSGSSTFECSDAARWCQTFEGVTDPLDLGPVDTSGGSVTMESAGAHGRVLRCDTSASDGGGVLARIQPALPDGLSSNQVKLSFDFMVSNTTARTGSWSLSVGDSSASCTADFDYEPANGYELSWYCVTPDGGVVNNFGKSKLATAPLLDTWTHVDVLLDVAQKAMTLTINGAGTQLTGVAVPFLSGMSPTKVNVSFGVNLATVGPARTVRFDNVSLSY